METKHTQGPWEMFNNHEGIIGVVGIPADVAYCCAPGMALDQRRTDEEHEANARLIAAAPELLLSLDRIIRELPHRRDWLDPVTEQLAKEAISKAIGG